MILEQQRLLARTHGGATAHAVSYELPLRYKGVRYADEKRRHRPRGGRAGDRGDGGRPDRRDDRHRGRPGAGRPAEADDRDQRAEHRLRAGGAARHQADHHRRAWPASQSYELSGPIAEASLTGLNLNVAFIGVDGIDAQAGCTTHHEVEAHTNAVMIGCARRVVVVADSSKIGKVAFARICEVTEISELITDAGADPEAVRALTDAGVKVTLVGDRPEP